MLARAIETLQTGGPRSKCQLWGNQMREIKFRGWNGHEMIDDPIIAGLMWFEDGRSFEDYTPCSGPLMQYTGLKDKNGKEIYEGDIVKHEVPYRGNQIRDKIQGAVYYKSGTHYVDADVLGLDGAFHKTLCSVADSGNKYSNAKYACELIGNIHENPELLSAP